MLRLLITTTTLMTSSLSLAAVYNGASCKAINGHYERVTYDDRGRIHNNTDYSVRVICPIDRQDHNKKWTSLKVVVADRSNDANVSCDAYSAQTDGLGWKITKSSSGSKPSAYASQTLTFGAPNETRKDGSLYLVCTIPGRDTDGKSGILTYRIVEPCNSIPINVSDNFQQPRYQYALDCK